MVIMKGRTSPRSSALSSPFLDVDRGIGGSALVFISRVQSYAWTPGQVLHVGMEGYVLQVTVYSIGVVLVVAQ